MRDVLCLLTISSALAADDGLATTPPRGWRSWIAFVHEADQAKMLAAIESLHKPRPLGASYRDVRAPVEFEGGAFPASVNLPIMNDAERHRAAVADFLHNNPLARGADGRADGAATPRHNRRQPTLPDELSKLLRQRARPDRIADLEGSFLRVAKGANVEVVDAQSGRRAPRFLRVDDEYQQLRWSWNIDHVLLIDEIAEVEWHGGARCTVHYHATHSSLEHQTLAWTLAFAKQHEAATWVSVLRLRGQLRELLHARLLRVVVLSMHDHHLRPVADAGGLER